MQDNAIEKSTQLALPFAKTAQFFTKFAKRARTYRIGFQSRKAKYHESTRRNDL
jgi:hypothetical protein